MLLHLRLNVPPEQAADVVRVLTDNECVTNVSRLEGASLEPAGDVIEADVARETTSEVLEALQEIGLDQSGGIVLTSPYSTPFVAAEWIEEAAPGESEDAVVWPEVLEQAEDAVKWSFAYQLFMILAVALAAVAVVTDSPILVVGAMVVGPEFGTVAAIAVGLVFRRWDLVGRSLRLLLASFAVAIAMVCVLAFLVSLTPLLDSDMLTRPRPMTGFIWKPDGWSFVVALLAGAAGALALSTNQGNAMVGVFISVTTIPAAGNMALAFALGDPKELTGSAQQLGVNLAGMVLAGLVVIALQRLLWGRALDLTDRIRGRRQYAR